MTQDVVDIERIVYLVESHEKTAMKIAEELGVHRSFFSDLKHGRKEDIRLGMAFKLADALGVDINEFRSDKK
ncbi:helix-turn-helix domain-containing protein [Hutsoniella sourekii]|uniref:helix-turn-helix domain-containing protein n=1 Tax=Hutsoniella sourekii TaxID=87650 RepID=UPI000558C108|nr:helix-turn-helix transcriptional regulator [Hutsoniella sourekii]